MYTNYELDEDGKFVLFRLMYRGSIRCSECGRDPYEGCQCLLSPAELASMNNAEPGKLELRM